VTSPATTFASFDGVQIAYGEAGPASADPVLLVHGFAADAGLNWISPGVLDAVAASGRRAIWVDCRGHGASDKPHDPAAYEHDAMAKDVLALADHVGVDRFDLVGYSMGARISLGLAQREPRVRSVVLGGVGAAVTRMGRPLDTRGVLEGLVADDAGAVDNQTGKKFRAFAESTGADLTALAAVVRAAMSDADPSAIHVPTLVLAGDRDTLVGSPQVLADLIPAARCVIVGGDHLSAVGKPEFRQAIVDFLDSVSVRT
jgi:pimeloyl-ACP methyl ester carboxylesterase